MTTSALAEQIPDSDLWQLVRQGQAPAFEVLVRRHQSLVCAVAYNTCGDLALSEDVAQETFWAAWRERQTLAEPGRVRAWLCGIARNLAKNARRRASRAAEAAATLDVAAGVSAGAPGPVEEAVSREEEALVWQSLEQVPESYREPLILFYREEQSVAEVAAALDLSEDAVKQRLSRGRALLRERVAELVEGVLQRSRPGRRFTVAVMTGLGAVSAGANTALAGTGAAGAGSAVVGAAVKTAVGTGLAGGILGSLVGLLGGWFGTWVSAQAAPTRRERDLIQRTGRRVLLVSVLFAIALIGLVLLVVGLPGPFPTGYYLIGLASWLVAFGIYITAESVRAAREVQRLRSGPAAAAEPNNTPLRGWAARYRGRVYRSRATFLGVPLLDINVSDPIPLTGVGQLNPAGRGIARGWIAIGDQAHGLLLAIGGRAFGFIAIGGLAVGVLSFGGLALGLVAAGGLGLGVVGIGGLAVGIWAFGGGAIGWQACGGGAIAWDAACGGGAIAWHAAYGGGALAHDYAVGGGAWAQHANDEAARAVLLDHPLKRGMDWFAANMTWMMCGIVLLSVLPCLMIPLLYRREKVADNR